MFFIAGKETAKIKSYTEYHQSCSNCKKFELSVKVHQEYFHLYYIPCFPLSAKSVEVNCSNCNETIHINALKDQYREMTKTPFWLYSGLIIIVGCTTWFSILLNT